MDYEDLPWALSFLLALALGIALTCPAEAQETTRDTVESDPYKLVDPETITPEDDWQELYREIGECLNKHTDRHLSYEPSIYDRITWYQVYNIIRNTDSVTGNKTLALYGLGTHTIIFNKWYISQDWLVKHELGHAILGVNGIKDNRRHEDLIRNACGAEAPKRFM